MNTNLKPYVANLTLAIADTQYGLIANGAWHNGYALTTLAGIHGISFQARTAADVRFAFVTGDVAVPAVPWLTLKAGTTFNSPAKMTLKEFLDVFFATDTAGTIIEALLWSA